MSCAAQAVSLEIAMSWIRTLLLSILVVLLASTAFSQDVPSEVVDGYSRGILRLRLADIKGAAVDDELIADLAARSIDGGFTCPFPDELQTELLMVPVREISDALSISEDAAAELQDLHLGFAEAIVGFATGKGAYPPGCNPAYPGVHSVAYYEDTTRPLHLMRVLTDAELQGIINAKVWGPTGDPRGPPFTMSQLKTAWGGAPMWQVVNDFSEETYRRWGVILYPVFTGPNGQHNIHVSFPAIPGSVIGVGWFPDSRACPGDHVNLHIDKTYTSGFQGQLGLKIHELGHTLQLPHQFSGQNSHQEPMSYSYSNHLVFGYSDGSNAFPVPKSPSIDLLTRLYGGKPVGKPWKGKFESVTPPPPVGEKLELNLQIEMIDGKPVIRNQFKVQGRDFIIVPRIAL
jgi:hypothetical protein